MMVRKYSFGDEARKALSRERNEEWRRAVDAQAVQLMGHQLPPSFDTTSYIGQGLAPRQVVEEYRAEMEAG